MRLSRRGLSIIELVLTLALVVMAFIAFMTIFSNSSRHSVQSRNRTVAIMVANNLMDEIEAHKYGDKAPQAWTRVLEQPVKVWVESRSQQMDFHKRLQFLNGSFVGNATADQDLVNITISWREGHGVRQTGGVDPEDDKVLTVSVPVWR